MRSRLEVLAAAHLAQKSETVLRGLMRWMTELELISVPAGLRGLANDELNHREALRKAAR